MKNLIVTFIFLGSFTAQASQYFSCKGLGNYNHLSASVKAKTGWFSNSINKVIFSTEYDQAKFSFEAMNVVSIPYKVKTMTFNAGLEEDAAVEFLKGSYFHGKIGSDNYFFSQQLLEGNGEGNVLVVDAPFALCVWDACSTSFRAYSCKSER